MKLRRLLPAALPLVLLAACATTAPTGAAALRPSLDVEFGGDEPGSAYGLYLAGEAAMADGKADEALGYFNRAGAADLEGGQFQDRAFIAALMSGDVDRAAQLAPTGPDAGPALAPLGALAQVVDAIAEGRGKDARTLLASGVIIGPNRSAAALLAPWVAASLGDKAGAVARPDLSGDRLVEVFGQQGQASLFERARRFDEAETDHKALVGLGDAGIIFVPEYGAFLERRGRWDEAVTLYDQALAAAPRDVTLLTARARAAGRKKAPPLVGLREGAARALLPTATALIGERQYGMAQAYLGFVLHLDPAREDARVMLGDVLANGDDVEGARKLYAAVPADSAQYATARAKLAWTYQQERQGEQGLKMAREGYEAAPDDDAAAITYADLLRANERYAESARVIDGVIQRAGPTPGWRLLYMRGIALERAGQWPAAEKDLVAALAQEPNEPDLLNYLGYAWIDRGERLAEAMDMVRRAVAANPRSGAMVDSLGWAYYRLGDYRNAVEKLEEAVLLAPGDPEINNHLGDAYWRIGRKVEAGFQWSRALSLDPSAAIKLDAETKLKSGLPPLKAVVSAANP